MAAAARILILLGLGFALGDAAPQLCTVSCTYGNNHLQDLVKQAERLNTVRSQSENHRSYESFHQSHANLEDFGAADNVQTSGVGVFDQNAVANGRRGNWSDHKVYNTDGGYGRVHEEQGQIESDNAKMRYYRKNYTASFSSGSPVASIPIIPSIEEMHRKLQEDLRLSKVLTSSDQLQLVPTGTSSSGQLVQGSGQEWNANSHGNTQGYVIPSANHGSEVIRKTSEKHQVLTETRQLPVTTIPYRVPVVDSNADQRLTYIEIPYPKPGPLPSTQGLAGSYVSGSSSFDEQQRNRLVQEQRLSPGYRVQPVTSGYERHSSGYEEQSSTVLEDQRNDRYRNRVQHQHQLQEQQRQLLEQQRQRQLQEQQRRIQEEQRRIQEEQRRIQEQLQQEQFQQLQVHQQQQQTDNRYTSGGGYDARLQVQPSHTAPVIHRKEEEHRWSKKTETTSHSGSLDNYQTGVYPDRLRLEPQRSGYSQQSGFSSQRMTSSSGSTGADCDQTQMRYKRHTAGFRWAEDPKNTRFRQRSSPSWRPDDLQQAEKQFHSDLTQQTEDLTQQTEDLTQQSEDLTQQSEDLTQQSQQSPFEFDQQQSNNGFGIELGSLNKKNEDLTQQSEDLTQQTQQSSFGFDQQQSNNGFGIELGSLNKENEDLTQQSEDLTQQTQQSEDLTQQSHQTFDQQQSNGGFGIELGSLTKENEDLTQQTQQSEDLTQQSEDLTQQSHQKFDQQQSNGGFGIELGSLTKENEDLTQQTQQSEDLTQQSSFGFDQQQSNNGFGLQVGSLTKENEDLTRQTQDLTQQSEDLTQQSEDLTQQSSFGLDRQQSNGGFGIEVGSLNKGKEDLTQQTQQSDDLTQQSSFGFDQEQSNGGFGIEMGSLSKGKDDLTQQSQDFSQQTQDLTQQTQQLGDFTQQSRQTSYGIGRQQQRRNSRGGIEIGDLNKGTEDLTQQSEDLTQQTQQAPFGIGQQQQRRRNSGYGIELGSVDQRDSSLTQQSSDLTQQTQQSGDLTQQTSFGIGQQRQRNRGIELGNIFQKNGDPEQQSEDLTQQSQQSPFGTNLQQQQQQHNNQNGIEIGSLIRENQDLAQQTQDFAQQIQNLAQQSPFGTNLQQQQQHNNQNGIEIGSLTRENQDSAQETQDFAQQMRDLAQQTQDLTQQVNDWTRNPQDFGQLSQQPHGVAQQSQDLAQQSQDTAEQSQTGISQGHQHRYRQYHHRHPHSYHNQEAGELELGSSSWTRGEDDPDSDYPRSHYPHYLRHRHPHHRQHQYVGADLEDQQNLHQSNRYHGTGGSRYSQESTFRGWTGTGTGTVEEPGLVNPREPGVPEIAVEEPGLQQQERPRPAPKPTLRPRYSGRRLVPADSRGEEVVTPPGSNADGDDEVAAKWHQTHQPGSLTDSEPQTSPNWVVSGSSGDKTSPLVPSSLQGVSLQQSVPEVAKSPETKERPGDTIRTDLGKPAGVKGGVKGRFRRPPPTSFSTSTSTTPGPNFEPRILEAFGGRGPYTSEHNGDIYSGVRSNPSATIATHTNESEDPWEILEKPAGREFAPDAFAAAPEPVPILTTAFPEFEPTEAPPPPPPPSFWGRLGNRLNTAVDKAKEKVRGVFG